MLRFKELTESRGMVVMSFSRMNPPTIGHLKLADKQKSIAGSKPSRIYLSQTVGPKDPLPFPKKVAYVKKSFGSKHAKSIMADKSVKTFIQAAQKLYEEGYTELVMVAGSDRIQEFQRLLDTYNGKPDKKGNIVFDFPDGVKVVSSGERDPDSADPTEAISASVMRKAAQDGDFDTFKKGSPLKEPDAKKMYLDVRKFMGVREERELGDDYDSLRDAYLTGKIWNVGEVVEAKGLTGEVVRKGTNYLSFVTEDGKVHKAWLHEIEAPDIKKGDTIILSKGKRKYSMAGITDPKTTLPAESDKMVVQKITKSKKGRKAHLTYHDTKKRGGFAIYIDQMPDFMSVKKEAKSPLQKLKDFDKSRVAAGKPPIFTDKKPPKFIRMKKSGQMTIMNVPTDEIDKFEKKGYKIIEEVDLDERNYAKEYANYQGTPEQIARRSSRNKARRAMGDKAVKGMDVGHADNNPMNNDPKNLRMEKPSDNRREPRLREEDELDEMAWYKVALAKISQLNHPKDYEKMLKQYTVDMKKPELKNKTASYIAARIANQYKGQDGRKLVQYINKLVNDGKLPKELKAEYQEEETMQTFSDLVKQINEVKQDKDVDDKDGTQPAKYYAGDMAKSTKSKRDAHFKAKKAGPAPGDASAKTKPSTHTKKFKQMYGEALPKDADQGDYIDDFEKSDAPQFKGKSKEKRKDMAIAAYLSKNEEVELDEKIEGLVNKAEKSGMPYSILKKVYDRGMAAWKTGHRPGTTPQQWAMARVNSFVTKSSGTWGKADKDLAKQVEQIEEACWDGYKQVGMKKKGNKEVPNCVPEEKELNEWGEIEEEAEYQGRKVTLNKPTAGDVKKSKVYVKNEKGNVVKVNFGDPDMKIKVSDPARRKSFRARHNCENPGPKWKARYWSCKAW